MIFLLFGAYNGYYLFIRLYSLWLKAGRTLGPTACLKMLSEKYLKI